MKIINKIIVILIIIFLLISICTNVFAINPETYKPSNIPTKEEAKPLLDKAGIVLGAVRNAASAILVISIMVVGLKYIIGSVEDKANYKSTMIPYMIGAIMITGGAVLVSFIYEVFY